MLLSLGTLACSSGSRPEQPQASKDAAAQPGAPATPDKPAAQPSTSGDEDLPPIVRTSWKGDLDEIAKRRVVRVLVPYRRPEFFYMEGRPAGILYEAFQELEKVLNTKYKTTSANRIIVAPLPRFPGPISGADGRRLWRHRGGKHFDHGSQQTGRGLHQSDGNRAEDHCGDRGRAHLNLRTSRI